MVQTNRIHKCYFLKVIKTVRPIEYKGIAHSLAIRVNNKLISEDFIKLQVITSP